jgi:hypothetical protein
MMETVDAEELAQNAVESMVAIMFDVPLDEIDHFSFEAPPQHPNGVRVRLLPEEWQSAGTPRQERRCLDLPRGDRGHHGIA